MAVPACSNALGRRPRSRCSRAKAAATAGLRGCSRCRACAWCSASSASSGDSAARRRIASRAFNTSLNTGTVPWVVLEAATDNRASACSGASFSRLGTDAPGSRIRRVRHNRRAITIAHAPKNVTLPATNEPAAPPHDDPMTEASEEATTMAQGVKLDPRGPSTRR